MEKLLVDVAIIGGGIIGCSAALALRKSGLTVALIDKAAYGSQASGVNAGGVRQQGRDLVELPIARRACKLWPRLHEIVGDDVEFKQIGHLRLARTEEDAQMLEDYAAAARDYGLHLQLISGRVTREMFPWVSHKVTGSSLSVEDGHANPRLVTPAFGRAAKAHGAHVWEFTDVQHSQWTGAHFETTAPGLSIKSHHLVNAAGAWSGRFLSLFNESAPLSPRYPNLFVTEPVPYFLTKSIAVCGGGVYFRQVERGNVIIGGGPGWGDMLTERSRNRADTMLGQFPKAMELVPELEGLQIIRSWSGLEGDLPDKLPIIGISKTTPNLVHAFGFSGRGFQVGPAVGEIVCELVRDGRSQTPIDAFCISRFNTAQENKLANARSPVMAPAADSRA